MNIQKTRNYSEFKQFKQNRDTSESHINTLVRSIERKNLLDIMPILVDEQMRVVDGQHRLEAAKRLNLEVPYLQVEGLVPEDIMLLNANNRAWTINDYVKFFIEEGVEDYAILQAFSEKYKIRLSISRALLLGKAAHGGSDAQDFRDGNFRIKALDYAKRVGDTLNLLAPYVEDRGAHVASFVSAIARLVRANKDDEFVSKVAKKGAMLPKTTRINESIDLVEDVLNEGEEKKFHFPRK